MRDLRKQLFAALAVLVLCRAAADELRTKLKGGGLPPAALPRPPDGVDILAINPVDDEYLSWRLLPSTGYGSDTNQLVGPLRTLAPNDALSRAAYQLRTGTHSRLGRVQLIPKHQTARARFVTTCGCARLEVGRPPRPELPPLESSFLRQPL